MVRAPNETANETALWAFDLAGTLFRDDGLVIGVFRELARERGLDVADEWILAHMGMQKREVFRAMTGTDDVQDLVDTFDTRLHARIQRDGLEALPAASELLDRLRERGTRIGFTTGFSARIAAEIVDQFGWSFDGGAASDEVSHGRPAPDLIHLVMERTEITNPAKVIAVGDTPRDLHAGSAAGTGRIIGVCNGTHTRAQLAGAASETGAELVESLEEVMGTLET